MKKRKMLSLLVLISVLMSTGGCGTKPETKSAGETDMGETTVAAAGQADETGAESGTNTDWPKKTINLVISMSPGGDGDTLTRLLAVELEKELGVSVAITNVAGGNGSVAMDQFVNDAPNDGTTFLVNNTAALSANQATGLTDYDYTVCDPVGVFAKHSGELLWVQASSPYQSMEDLISDSKKNPGKIKFGVSMGGSVYAAAVMLQNAGAEVSLVDAGDGAERIVSLLGGQVDLCSAGYGIGKEYIDSGDLRPLCTLMGSRSAALPDVPTAEESGVEGLVINNLFLILAPKGTDPAIIQKFNSAIQKVTADQKEYGEAVTQYSGQPAYALNVEDTIAELEKQRKQFMAISDSLK